MPDEPAPQQSQGGSYFGVRSPSAATAASAAVHDSSSAVYSDTFPLMSGNSPVVLPAGREFQLLSAHNHSHSHYRQASMDGREVAVDLVQQVRTSTFAARGGEGALEIEENMEDRVRGVQRQSVLVSSAQLSPKPSTALVWSRSYHRLLISFPFLTPLCPLCDWTRFFSSVASAHWATAPRP